MVMAIGHVYRVAAPQAHRADPYQEETNVARLVEACDRGIGLDRLLGLGLRPRKVSRLHYIGHLNQGSLALNVQNGAF